VQAHSRNGLTVSLIHNSPWMLFPSGKREVKASTEDVSLYQSSNRLYTDEGGTQGDAFIMSKSAAALSSHVLSVQATSSVENRTELC